MNPARGLLLVRPVETAEALPGSRILLPADTRERLTANQCEVLAVGAFAECDDEDCERPHAREHDCWVCGGENGGCAECADFNVHAHPVRVGDWILVTPRTFISGPEPERKEWFVHQDAVLGIFNEE